MNAIFPRALVVLVPASMLLSRSLIFFLRDKTAAAFLQVIGAACLIVVVLTHFAEAFHWLPGMHWGSENSVGHYVDLCAAVLGISTFSVGYLLHALKKRVG